MEKVEEVIEGQADWAALEASIAKPVEAPGTEPEIVKDPAKAWAELPAMFGSLLAIALPEIKAFYTPEACQEWGEKMVPVAAEMGWDYEEVMGPKVALAVASVPFVVGPIVIIKARKAAALPEPAKAGQAAAPGALVDDPGAGQTSVTFG